MVVRIRFDRGLRVKRTQRKNKHVALAAATLLSPAKVAALALGCWRLAADLRITARFAISDGLFSHWQVWVGIAGIFHVVAMALNRYGGSEPMLPNSEQKQPETILDSVF